jgi:flagellar basal-body rod modification protein FlgD
MELGYKLEGDAKDVTVMLENNGAVVAVLEGNGLTSGSHYLSWDGQTTAGLPAPNGLYRIRVQTQGADGQPVEATPLVRSEVTGVDLQGDKGSTLITKAGEIAFTSILGVFEPGSKPAGSEPDRQSQDAEKPPEIAAVTAEPEAEVDALTP